jgi:branched-subunit amino acid transport protein
MSFMKLMMLFEGILFVKVNESSSICTLDNLEVFPLTPRYLSLFTISFFSSSVFIGKTATDRTQYNFQKSCPFFIAGLHTIILVMRRRYLFTIDDILVSIMFMTSLSLYLSLEYKQPKVLQRIIPKKVPTVTSEARKQPPPTRQQQKVAKKEINIEQYEEVIESDDGIYGEESSSET